MSAFAVESYLVFALFLALMAVKVFALVSSLLFSTESYRAADKLTKPAWCAILGLGLACQFLFSPLNFINLAFTIAALVYLADVRPALASLTRR
ncbi:DUF2516 family protein [Nocardioides sp.]|uniref:DUF2516 family protein n=1 Tax=Nocardioides sp. TaxID=35761 RepID=UPI002D805B4D|nr:DUF2516 family protein [Nocardioides sp.]HET8959810.1 DUF2516 family protein [Nocardioides sp.]